MITNVCVCVLWARKSMCVCPSIIRPFKLPFGKRIHFYIFLCWFLVYPCTLFLCPKSLENYTKPSIMFVINRKSWLLSKRLNKNHKYEYRITHQRTDGQPDGFNLHPLSFPLRRRKLLSAMESFETVLVTILLKEIINVTIWINILLTN